MLNNTRSTVLEISSHTFMLCWYWFLQMCFKIRFRINTTENEKLLHTMLHWYYFLPMCACQWFQDRDYWKILLKFTAKMSKFDWQFKTLSISLQSSTAYREYISFNLMIPYKYYKYYLKHFTIHIIVNDSPSISHR